MRLLSRYRVDSYYDILLPIAKSLKEESINYPLTLIYLPLFWCGQAYKLFERVLKEKQYYPKDSLQIPENRLFAQFYSPQDSQMKSVILEQITQKEPTSRVIFATSALGMGVDAPSIREIIHIGPPRSLEAYFQETGRACRDGCKSKAKLYFNRSDIHKSVKDMKDSIRTYCDNNDECLRKLLLAHFNYTVRNDRLFHECCSYCFSKCGCQDCMCRSSNELTNTASKIQDDAGTTGCRRF